MGGVVASKEDKQREGQASNKEDKQWDGASGFQGGQATCQAYHIFLSCFEWCTRKLLKLINKSHSTYAEEDG